MRVHTHRRALTGFLLLVALLLGSAGAGVVSSGVAQTQPGQQLVAIAQAAANAAAKAEAEAKASKEATDKSEASAQAQLNILQKETAEAKAEAQASAEAVAQAEVQIRKELETILKAAASAVANAQAWAKASAEAKTRVEAEAKAAVDAAASASAKASASASASAKVEAEAKATATASAQASAEANARAKARAQATASAVAQANASAQACAVEQARAEASASAAAQAFTQASAKAGEVKRLVQQAQDQAPQVCKAAEQKLQCTTVKAEACGSATAMANSVVTAGAFADASASATAEAAAFAKAQAEATAVAVARAQAEATAAARAQARAEASAQAIARAMAQSEAAASAMAKATAEAAATAKAKADAAASAKAKAEAKAQAAAEAMAQAVAEANSAAEAAAKAEAEAKAKAEIALKAIARAKASAQASAEAAAKAETEVSAKVKVVAKAFAEAKAKAEARAKAAAEANAKAQAALEATKKAVQDGKLDEAQAQAKATVDASAEAWAHAHATADAWVKTEAQVSVDLEFVIKQSAEASAKAHAAADALAEVHTEVTTNVEVAAQAQAQASAQAYASANALAQAEAKASVEVQAAVEAAVETSANAEASVQALASAHAEVAARTRAIASASAEASAQATAQAEAVAQAQASATASADAFARATAWADASAFASARASASANAVVQTFTQAQTSVKVIQNLDTTITAVTDPTCKEKECDVPTLFTLTVNALGPGVAATAGTAIVPIQVPVTLRRSGSPDTTKTTTFSLKLAKTNLTAIVPATATVGSKQLRFKEWQEQGGSTSTANSRDVTLDRDRVLTAIYEEVSQQVPELTVSPTVLEFRGQVGSPGIPAQSFRVTNTGQGILNWSARNSASWLRLVTRSGTLAAGASQDITVQVDISGLSAGTRQDEIIVEAPGARNSPQRVRVTLTLEQPQPSCNENLQWFFGTFDGGTSPSFTAIRSFPSDVSAAIARCNIVSGQLGSSSLPSGVSFALDVSGRTGRLSGALPNTSTTYTLVYDLFDNQGRRAGVLTVNIEVRSVQQCCTLNFRAFVQLTNRAEANVPITVNGVSRTTPFTVQLPLNAPIGIQAPTTIRFGDANFRFDRWESDGQFLSRNNPLSGRTDKNETIAAIYVTSEPSPSSPCNTEFSGSSFDPAFTPYLPKSGPTFSLTANPGRLRLDIPSNIGTPGVTFDHWTNVDEAPQLRCAAPSGNWEMTTRLRVLNPTDQQDYHVGLMIVFSRFDLFYWGIYRGAQIQLEISGTKDVLRANLANPNAEIELMIAKDGNTYSFSYRAVGASTWTLVGRQTRSGTPQFVGLIGKTWSPARVTADFDYLRVQIR